MSALPRRWLAIPTKCKSAPVCNAIKTKHRIRGINQQLLLVILEFIDVVTMFVKMNSVVCKAAVEQH